MKRPDFPLGEAVSWFLTDMQSEVTPTTLATYRSHLTRFCASLQPARRTLDGVFGTVS